MHCQLYMWLLIKCCHPNHMCNISLLFHSLLHTISPSLSHCQSR